MAIRCRVAAGIGGGHAAETRARAWPSAPRRFWRCSPRRIFYLHRAPKLTAKDTIVLADFENKTGDPVFDQTLRQGLAVQLEQSPFLSLVSDESIKQALRLMNRPAETPLTPEIAREICERTGSAAVLEGSIAGLGKPVRFVAARQELPQRRRPGPGAGAGRKEGRGPECAEPDCGSDPDPAGRVAGHHPGALDAAGAGNHVVARSSEGIQRGENRRLRAWWSRPRSPTFSAPSPSIRNSRWRMPIWGSMSWNMGQTDLGAEEVRKAYELAGSRQRPGEALHPCSTTGR